MSLPSALLFATALVSGSAALATTKPAKAAPAKTHKVTKTHLTKKTTDCTKPGASKKACH